MGDEASIEFAVCSPLLVVCSIESLCVYWTSLVSLYVFCGVTCLGWRVAASLTLSVVGELVVVRVCTCIWDTGGYKGPCYITHRVIHLFSVISKIIFFFFLGFQHVFLSL